MSEQDTREQLEADVASILRNAANHTSANTSIGDMLRYTVPGSGAAPWQTAEDACEALASIAERQIAELTAELETYRKYAEQGECEKPQSRENGDTRERLEKCLRLFLGLRIDEEPDPTTSGIYYNILGLLDRQAAITRRETLLENPLHNNPYVGLVRGKQWERKQASDYYCGKCGYPVTDHDSYCPECGGAFHKASNKPNSQFDVLKTAENAENVTSKNEIRNFDDSREKLEDDLEKLRKQWKEYDGNFMRIYSYVAYSQIVELLDRQAAITEREVKLRELCKFEENHRANIDATEEVNRKLNERIAELQAAIDAMENGQFYSMYKAKCEECKEAVSFAKRVENAVNDGQPVTLFGVDYFNAKQNKKLLAGHEQLLKKLKRLRRRLAKAKKERDYLQKVVKTQAESFKKLECELAGKDG